LTQLQSIEPNTGSPPVSLSDGNVRRNSGKAAANAAPEARSLLATAWLRIRRSKIALLSLCVVVAIMLFAILAPFAQRHVGQRSLYLQHQPGGAG
jgi:hypothetical protein